MMPPSLSTHRTRLSPIRFRFASKPRGNVIPAGSSESRFTFALAASPDLDGRAVGVQQVGTEVKRSGLSGGAGKLHLAVHDLERRAHLRGNHAADRIRVVVGGVEAPAVRQLDGPGTRAAHSGHGQRNKRCNSHSNPHFSWAFRNISSLTHTPPLAQGRKGIAKKWLSWLTCDRKLCIILPSYRFKEKQRSH